MTRNFSPILAATPTAKPELLTGIEAALKKYSAKYPLQGRSLQMFLAQAATETDGFRALKEYASGTAYEGRKDLGNTVKGDGVRFKGRGIFHTTGRANYGAMSQAMFGDLRLLSHPELLEQPEAATLSALIYWHDRDLSEIASRPDSWRSKPIKIAGRLRQLNPFQYVTYRINGGQNEQAKRETYFSNIKKTGITYV